MEMNIWPKAYANHFLKSLVGVALPDAGEESLLVNEPEDDFLPMLESEFLKPEFFRGGFSGCSSREFVLSALFEAWRSSLLAFFTWRFSSRNLSSYKNMLERSCRKIRGS